MSGVMVGILPVDAFFFNVSSLCGWNYQVFRIGGRVVRKKFARLCTVPIKCFNLSAERFCLVGYNGTNVDYLTCELWNNLSGGFGFCYRNVPEPFDYGFAFVILFFAVLLDLGSHFLFNFLADGDVS